ncbi:unnamed protein product [Brachionus calyciflorus]|uniref:NADH dehydrogenase [ubiquinone] flavoprotein 3, mitochondrial n=1 Tax=Brachionus calyciflorus TaxID=104777 RepID=A0A813NXB2_9BILA|nr:unnamed protein product [Brachionus calyciflorus]
MEARFLNKILKINPSRSLNSIRALSQKPQDTNKKPSSEKQNYQAPELFKYNMYSYFDFDNQMIKYRQPQPSSLPTRENTWKNVVQPKL